MLYSQKGNQEMITISNRVEKPKKTAQELVNMLRDDKGIRFQIMDETAAEDYLSKKNNYLRTASYRKNYDKYECGINKGKYINLEFAYLTEVSTLDMHLRNLLLPMCIDIEHALKVKIIKEIETNNNEDGYSIVDDFLKKHPQILTSIEEKADSVFTGELISKYFNLCSVFDYNGNVATKILCVDCPAWVFVEIIGFRNLIIFIDYYNSKYQNAVPINKNVLNAVRSLRNACAHNNCLLNCMRPHNTKAPSEISDYVKNIPSIGKEERVKKLSCRPLFEYVCLIYVYDAVVSEKVKEQKLILLKDFCNNRLMENIAYFKSNQIVLTAFGFMKKIIDSAI